MTALEILKKVRLEMRPNAKVGEFDLPVIIKAMHEYAALRQPHIGDSLPFASNKFNEITDLRPYLLRHPDQEMIKASCLHYLGDDAQKRDSKKHITPTDVNNVLAAGYPFQIGDFQIYLDEDSLVKADVINLLPCPFCGSKAEKRVREGTGDYDWDKVFYDIRCTNDDCYLQDGADWNCKTYKEVVAMWNKRQ